MQRNRLESRSIWQDQAKPEPSLQKLHKNLSTDICVVGAGIAGLTIAYHLQKEGRDVVVLDAWGLSAGETSRTTAHLTAVLDDRFYKLHSLFGEEGARLAAESHMSAINFIENVVRDEHIDCDFERVTGYLAAHNDKQKEELLKEYDVIRQVGFNDARLFMRTQLPHLKNGGQVIEFPQQACFHIANYMTGLCYAFEGLGGQIYVGARVIEVRGGKKAFVRTDEGLRIEAKHIVVATNTPINDRVKMHTKQAAYRTYVVGYRIPKNSYPGFLYWDLDEPYHYARVVRGRDHDALIVGGEDHKTGQAQDMSERYRRLDQWTRDHFYTYGAMHDRWSGQIMEPVDSLGFIGRNPNDEENVYIATGDSGNGMTHGTIAGLLISDLIQKRKNPWESLYDPSRKSLKAAGSFISENVNAASHMIKDHLLRASDTDGVDKLQAGEGALLRRNGLQIATYRDEIGRLHEFSAVCPHLGCIVQWNPGEKSWDCPCHGSRFDCKGEVLNGPAARGLALVKLGENKQRKMAG